MSLVFYDTETTGLDAPFGQILQFAAIRTDENLKDLERFEIRCRLMPHIVPAPTAMQVTGITVAQLTDESLPSHYQMVCAIHNKLKSWSPSNFAGFNSIDFDEHFLRQAFYQSLHHPYLTNCDGNTRADVMRIARAASLFAPGAISIPCDEEGKQTFKLAELAPANGFDHSEAHDAMGDVEATLFLAKLLFERAPEVWSTAMRFSKKAAVKDFIESEQVFSLSDFYFGKAYSWLVTRLGVNADNNSEHYLFNLAVDPSELAESSDLELGDRLRELPKPVRCIRINAAPFLMAAFDAPDIASGRELGEAELERRAELLSSDAGLRNRLITAFKETRDERETSVHVEEQIYAQFTSNEDMRLIEQFHRLPWNARIQHLKKLEDNRLRKLGMRLIHAEMPCVLEANFCKTCDIVLAKRLLGVAGEVPWLTLPAAIEEIDDLLVSADPSTIGHLQEHHIYLSERLRKAKYSLADAMSHLA